MSIKPKVSVLDLEWVESKNSQTHGHNEVDLIEIGIVNLDYSHDQGWREVERYTTLFQRQEKIPTRIAQLTGIKHQDLLDAPLFYQVHELIELLTRNRILVGHSVAHDYKHLQHEMKKYVGEYQRETFCTLEMAKIQWPELQSYELAELCHLLGEKNITSHRALDDAESCAKIFKRIAPSPRKNQKLKPVQVDLKSYFPWLSYRSLSIITTAKDLPAIFSLYSHNKLLWIGSLESAKIHLLNQLIKISKDTSDKKHPVTHLNLSYEENEVCALVKVENIKTKIRPTWQRQRPVVYAIYEYRDQKGLLRLKVRRAHKGKKVALFHTLSKKKALRVAELWESNLAEYRKLIYSQKEEQTKWIEKINKQRKDQLHSLSNSKTKGIFVEVKDSKNSKQVFLNPFKNLYIQSNSKLNFPKLDLAGHCIVLDLIQKIKGRNNHPYKITEFNHHFTHEYLQRFFGSHGDVLVESRP